MSIFNESELLLHIADLADAFAGFAGIGTALGEHVLVPFIPTLFGIEESSAWRVAAISPLGAVAVFLPGTAMRTKRMKRYAGFGTRKNVFNFGLGAVAIAGFLSCALGFPSHSLSAACVSGLAALLLISAILFFPVMVYFLRPHAPY